MIQRPIPWPTDIAAAADAFAGGDEMVWLDAGGPDAGLSAIARRPMTVVGGAISSPLRVTDARGRDSTLPATWDSLTALLRRRLPARDRTSGTGAGAASAHISAPANGAPPARPSIGPGWFGFLGYEFGQSDRVPAWPAGDACEAVRLGYYEVVVVLDHAERTAKLLADAAAPARAVEEAVRDWEKACRQVAEESTASPLRLRTTPDPAAHAARVRAALEYIAAGDIYQVNLAQAFEIEGVQDALALHRATRYASPARYGAFLRWPGGAVSSISPELFLQVRGRDVLTRPIKGTRPRTGVKSADDLQEAALLASVKDAAELAMIVDLHRNDLGRVAAPGSVQVRSARRLEVHPTVFHTVADITARLADGHDGLDALRAAFPAGSITGAPKLRAMQIIRELEPRPRGVFSGAIGHIGPGGDLTLNVAIRTAFIRDGVATIHAGGGIVADSEPLAEYDETLAKAAAFFRAAGVALPAAR